jgi:hypothetical protein
MSFIQIVADRNSDGWIVVTSRLRIFQSIMSWGLCDEETEGVGSRQTAEVPTLEENGPCHWWELTRFIVAPQEGFQGRGRCLSPTYLLIA